MENRKNSYTPCERIEDSILTEILREKKPVSKAYVSSGSRGGSCGCRRRASDALSNCSCVRNNEIYAVRRDSCPSTHDNDRSSCRDDNKMRRIGNCRANTDTPRPCNYNDSNYAQRREDSVNRDDGCGCERCMSNSCINGYPVAMVYCPDHEFDNLFGCEEALERGTLFRLLDLPFYPGKCNDCR